MYFCTQNRIDMKKILFYSLFLLALCSCVDEKDPFVDPGNTENPNWVITVENNMTASMTAIVKVSFTEKEGTLAAFMGNECCGIAEFIDGLYWLYITPASEDGGAVQLRFYSPDLKRIFDAKETFNFANDSHLGTVADPYTPKWEVAK